LNSHLVGCLSRLPLEGGDRVGVEDKLNLGGLRVVHLKRRRGKAVAEAFLLQEGTVATIDLREQGNQRRKQRGQNNKLWDLQTAFGKDGNQSILPQK